VFEPVRDEFFIEMNVNLFKLTVTRVHKFMWCVRWRNDDLSGVRDQCFRADGKGACSFLNDENFWVRVLMQPNIPSRRHIYPDEGHLGIPVLVPFKIICAALKRQVTFVQEDITHTLFL